MASDVPSLFAASLVIDQRKAAEAQLETLAVHVGFLPHLLQIVLDRNQPMQVRQAACLYFKNQIKRRWDDVCILPGRPIHSSDILDGRAVTGGDVYYCPGQGYYSREPCG